MIIGLTGLIGSGKSTVANFFSEHGFVVIDADKAGHEILRNDETIKAEIISHFGEEILDSLGNIDREKLGNIVFNDNNFNDNTELERLNSILHPAIMEKIKASISSYKDNNINDILIEAALLIEIGMEKLVDKTILVKADKEKIFSRMKKTFSKKKIEKIISHQMPEEEKLIYADFAIDNNGTQDETKKQVGLLIKKLISQNRHIFA